MAASAGCDALTLALAYLAGVRGSATAEVEEDAAIIADCLARQGFGIVPLADIGSGRLPPATLRAMREGLGLTVTRLAREAGVSEKTVQRAEQPASRGHRSKAEAIVAALERLGAKIADEGGADERKGPSE